MKNCSSSPTPPVPQGNAEDVPSKATGDFAHLFFFGANKAGMTDDAKEKETRDQVVYEMSKNSLYFQRAQKQDEKNKRKSEELLSQLSRMTPAQLETCQGTYEAVVLDLEARRDFRRICCVIGTYWFIAVRFDADIRHL